MLNIRIRDEKPGDVDQIRQVTELAFRHAPHTNHTEQFIVEALRQSDALTVSLVAEAGGEIVGHVAISPVGISDGASNWYGLGPVSVRPEYQRGGIGTRMVTMALAAIESKGASGCVVLGDPGYYTRFGFRPTEGLVLPGVPPEYFQVLSFGSVLAHGEVAYHEAFSAQN